MPLLAKTGGRPFISPEADRSAITVDVGRKPVFWRSEVAAGPETRLENLLPASHVPIPMSLQPLLRMMIAGFIALLVLCLPARVALVPEVMESTSSDIEEIEAVHSDSDNRVAASDSKRGTAGRMCRRQIGACGRSSRGSAPDNERAGRNGFGGPLTC